MILVTGATGNVGRELVPQLLDLKQSVRVLTRDAHKVAHWKGSVEVTIGSFEQPDTLDAAMQSVKQVFLLSAGLEASHAKTAVWAARRTGVPHIVYLSSMGAGNPNIQLFRWHHESEEAIRDSGLIWTFLRPGQFMSNALMWAETIKSQETVYFPGGNGTTAPIDPRDIAAVAALALTQPGHESKIYELTGAEPLTAGKQVEILSRVLGKPLRYVDVPPAAAREGMIKSGMSVVVADAVAELFTMVREGRASQTTDTFERIVGKAPRTFEAWCQDHVAAFQ
jgi:uncharacterized protein YbjT (DUF2867 family)